MKQILPLIFLFVLSLGSNAQIAVNPPEMTQDTILDLADTWISTKMHADIENAGAANVELRWEIFKIDAPDEWDVQLCVDADYGGCFSWGTPSNIDPAFGLDIPLVIVPNGASIWDFGMRPNGVGGCGTYEIRVTTTDDLNTVIATSTHIFKTNADENCESTFTSISDFDKKALKLFPNPTTDYFTLTDNNYVKEIQIFNIVGKRMTNAPFQNGEAINIGSYPNGLYLVRMLDKDGEILKTTRLTKR